MGMPKIPDEKPKDLDASTAAAWVAYSVALEELALAHIINAEGEKIQFVLGTLPDSYYYAGSGQQMPATPSVNDLVKINNSVRETLETIICKEIVLNLKLCQALHFLSAQYGSQSQQAPVNP